MCNKQLKVEDPSLKDLNQMIARYNSTLMSQMRFGGSDTSSISSWITNMIGFPREILMTPSYGPFTPLNQGYSENLEVKDLLSSCFEPSSYLNGTSLRDPYDKSIATLIMFQGDIIKSELILAAKFLRRNRSKMKLAKTWGPGAILATANKSLTRS